MSSPESRLNIHARIEELLREIQALRGRLPQEGTAERNRLDEELRELERRHRELGRKLESLTRSAVASEDPVMAEIEADLEGLSQSVYNWIARLDTRA
ncbi:MAG: hypothetical protein QOK29_1647 [Rhodospirillaceae bacterium]|jgi:chromosome segregation ATPase|nr:hypothetical protein [Rhodospirillaceae bacterium]